MKKAALSMLVATLMVAIFTFSGFTALAAQNPQQQQAIRIVPQPGVVSVSGIVYGFPLNGTGPITLADAQVFIGGGKLIQGITFALKSTTTNQNGYYQFENMPIGTYLILARKPGEYLPGFRLVILTEANPIKTNVDVYLLHKIFGNTQQLMEQGMALLPEGQGVLFQELNQGISV